MFFEVAPWVMLQSPEQVAATLHAAARELQAYADKAGPIPDDDDKGASVISLVRDDGGAEQ